MQREHPTLRGTLVNMSHRPARPVAAIALALTLVTAGCGGGAEDAAPAVNDAGQEVEGGEMQGEAASATGSLTAQDQQSDGKTITVDSVEIDGAPGWIAVHSDVDGAPGPVLGQVLVEEGSGSDVEITLDKPLDGDAAVWPMLHVDDSELGTYEFPGVEGADLPVTEGEKPVMMQIEITVG